MSDDQSMKESIAIPIVESSQTGEARRVALALAGRLGFNEVERGKVGIVVTELANNLVQHAGGGVVLLRAIEQYPTLGIEVLALDQGRGMLDVDECLKDGFSTGGTAGNGLGAIHRLSSFCEVYSPPRREPRSWRIFGQTQNTIHLKTLWKSVVCAYQS
jgi:anti-sigma regulatory factor (Ser/Thr protein kinase)